jgi:two-component system nitrogen regulation sensor histidine kinase GlnL
VPGADQILGSLGVAVIALDENLIVTYFNLAAQDLFGLSERQAVGHSLKQIIATSDELIELCERSLKQGVTIGRRSLKAKALGRELNLDCRASPLEAASGGVLLELHDHARERTIVRESQIRAGQRVSRQIVRQLAHEVKNPLGGMRGAAQLLERKLPTEDLKRYTEIIIAEADRLAALVDRVLGAVGSRREETISPHRLTEHVAELISAEAPPGVAIVRDYDPSLPPVSVDRDQMVQALLNVVRNAVQAVGAKGRIILRTRVIPNFVIAGKQYRVVDSIEIEDNGPGIPEELQENIFLPLVTGRPDGTGVGLTIAQDLVSGNGGLLEYDSRPGSTVFRIRLPAQLPGRVRSRND